MDTRSALVTAGGIVIAVAGVPAESWGLAVAGAVIAVGGLFWPRRKRPVVAIGEAFHIWRPGWRHTIVFAALRVTNSLEFATAFDRYRVLFVRGDGRQIVRGAVVEDPPEWPHQFGGIDCEAAQIVKKTALALEPESSHTGVLACVLHGVIPDDLQVAGSALSVSVVDETDALHEATRVFQENAPELLRGLRQQHPRP